METKSIHYGFLYDLFVKKATLQWHRDVDDILLCARSCAIKYRCRTLQDLYRSNSEGEQITFFKIHAAANSKTSLHICWCSAQQTRCIEHTVHNDTHSRFRRLAINPRKNSRSSAVTTTFFPLSLFLIRFSLSVSCRSFSFFLSLQLLHCSRPPRLL